MTTTRRSYKMLGRTKHCLIGSTSESTHTYYMRSKFYDLSTPTSHHPLVREEHYREVAPSRLVFGLTINAAGHNPGPWVPILPPFWDIGVASGHSTQPISIFQITNRERERSARSPYRALNVFALRPRCTEDRPMLRPCSISQSWKILQSVITS